MTKSSGSDHSSFRLNEPTLHAEYHRILRWAHVQADHMIRGKLEVFVAVRLQTEGFPHPSDTVVRKAKLLTHRTRAPVGRILWPLFKSRAYHLRYFLNGDGPRSATPWQIQQAAQPVLHKTLTPPANAQRGNAGLLGYLVVGYPRYTEQNHLCPLHIALRCRAPECRFLKLCLFLSAQYERPNRSAFVHLILLYQLNHFRNGFCLTGH